MADLIRRLGAEYESWPRDSWSSRAVRRSKGAVDEAKWRLTGRLGSPPPGFKRRLLRRTASEHGLRILVETGTYKGDTVADLRSHFDQLISVELSPVFAERARSRFASDPGVSIVEGDSATVLGPVVAGLAGPALFWLDGHASGGETARGGIGSPVVAELDVVLASSYPHVVLIDDAMLFDGTDGYPTLDRLRKQVLDAGHLDHGLVVRDDVIRLIPDGVRPESST